MRKVAWRIGPLMAAAFLFNYLDKINLGFAALSMNRQLGLSNADFGVAAGIFAVSYALFAVPSTLLLRKIGARRAIALMMIVWGCCSAMMALVTTARELMLARFLLGIAEAGFAPGAVVYFSDWFPQAYRGRAIANFVAMAPLGIVVGGPLSSAILSLDRALGVAGWQWLFIVEALPTLLLAVVLFVWLLDRPADARWLNDEEKSWLAGQLASEKAMIQQGQDPVPAWRILADGRVWMLATVVLVLSTAGVGAVYFMPLIIRSMGFSSWTTGFATTLPGIAATVATPLWGYWTDRAAQREHVVAAGLIVTAAGLLATAMLLPSPWALVPLAAAFAAYCGCTASVYTLPSAFLTGASAAACIALVNIVGNLGAFTGPAVLGRAADITGSYRAGLVVLAVPAAIATAIMGVLAQRTRRQAAAAPGESSRIKAPVSSTRRRSGR